MVLKLKCTVDVLVHQVVLLESHLTQTQFNPKMS